MAGKDTMDKQQLFREDTTEILEFENGGTIELVCKYSGNISFVDLLKSAMKRDVELALAEAENPYI